MVIDPDICPEYQELVDTLIGLNCKVNPSFYKIEVISLNEIYLYHNSKIIEEGDLAQINDTVKFLYLSGTTR